MNTKNPVVRSMFFARDARHLAFVARDFANDGWIELGKLTSYNEDQQARMAGLISNNRTIAAKLRQEGDHAPRFVTGKLSIKDGFVFVHREDSEPDLLHVRSESPDDAIREYYNTGEIMLGNKEDFPSFCEEYDSNDRRVGVVIDSDDGYAFLKGWIDIDEQGMVSLCNSLEADEEL